MVCVPHNVTHLLNVNKALYEAGLPRLKEFQKASNPEAWTWEGETKALFILELIQPLLHPHHAA